MSKAETIAEINRQLAAYSVTKRYPSALIAYLRILEKREREHGF